jgi:hypothetical protein
MGWFTFETCAGQPVQAGAHQITPYAQFLQIRWPNGGATWSRPVGIDVRAPDGQTRYLPVVDVTRLALVGIFAAAALSAALFWRK